jgi:hypothetical protein
MDEKVYISGMNYVLEGLDHLPNSAVKIIYREQEKAARACLAKAEEAAPVGEEYGQWHLRDTGFVVRPLSGNDIRTEVRFESDHALYVEMGHMSVAGNPVPPQHFLLPAFDEEAEALAERLDDKLQNIIP